MTTVDRLNALVPFGLTPRQTGFLALVLRHGGVCVPRQYAAFAHIAEGGARCHAFFATLVRRRLAVEARCVHNRARVYHVHHAALYRAIGEPHSRFRRPVPAAQVASRVVALDAVLATPDVDWLTTADEQRQLRRELLGERDSPSTSDSRPLASGARPRGSRVVPIGHDRDGRVVLLYAEAEPMTDTLRHILRAYADLLARAPQWTVRVVLPKASYDCREHFRRVVQEEYGMPLPSATIASLTRSFERRRARDGGRGEPGRDEGVSMPDPVWDWHLEHLYRAWCRAGSRVFEGASSPALVDALASGRGRVEIHALPFSYRHLVPVLPSLHRASSGVEEGERGGERPSAPPQPVTMSSADDVNTTPLS